MERVSSIFSRIVRLVPRSLFDRAVARRQGENHAAGMPCWSQVITRSSVICSPAITFSHGCPQLSSITGTTTCSEAHHTSG